MIAALGLLCLFLFYVSGQEKRTPRPGDQTPRPLKSPPDLPTPPGEPLPTDPLKGSTPTPTPTPPPIGCSTCATVPLFDLGPGATKFDVELAKGQKSTNASAIFSVIQSLDGISTITSEFKDAEEAPEGTRYVVWARSSDNEFIPLGEFKDPPTKVTFKRKLNRNRFGFFITLESLGKKINLESGSEQPSNRVVGVVLKLHN